MNRVKLFFMTAVATMVIGIGGLVSAAGAQTWDCGEVPETVTCVLDNGTFTVSGSGAMRNYERRNENGQLLSGTPPWVHTWINNRSALNGNYPITSVIVEQGVTNIGGGSFLSRSSLDISDFFNVASVSIPNSVTYIGIRAFENNIHLKTIALPSSVTIIEQEAFRNSGLISITIPNSVTSIGVGAFFGCTELTSVTMPPIDGERIIAGGGTIFNTVFLNSPNIAAITISGVGPMGIGFGRLFPVSTAAAVVIEEGITSIGDRAFESLRNLTAITIPNSVTTIGEGAFRGCSGLTSLTIPNSVTDIGEAAFNGTGLTSIIIPNSVTTIGAGAFHSCRDLASITIPNSVTTIGREAFANTGLTSVTIPNSVTSLGFGIFWGCTNLMSVTSLSPTPPAISGNANSAFQSTPNSACLYVPQSGIAAYRVASGWNHFNNCTNGLDGLATLTVSSGTLSPSFNPNTTNYTLSVPNNTTALTISATPSYSTASVTGIGAQTLSVGSNTFDITVDALSLSRTYTINVTRQPSYTVTYDGNGNTGGTPPAQQSHDNNSTVTVAAVGSLVRAGYMFMGWNTAPNGSGASRSAGASFTITENVTLYAQWAIDTHNYTVTYYGNSNTGGTVPTDANSPYDDGSTVIVLSAGNLVRTGHTFSGWNTAANGNWDSYAAGETFTITSNVSLFAQWSANIHTVTFNSQSGSNVGSQTVEHGNTVTEPTAPTRASHIFDGWYKEAANINVWNFDVDVVTSNITLYARWIPTNSIAAADREIPQISDEVAVVAPVNRSTAALTVGPNPADRQSGSVNFYVSGMTVRSGTLRIYDATGNVVRRLAVNDNTVTWDLKDARGRPVAEGTYLVRGTITSASGKRERVSAVVGVK